MAWPYCCVWCVGWTYFVALITLGDVVLFNEDAPYATLCSALMSTLGGGSLFIILFRHCSTFACLILHLTEGTSTFICSRSSLNLQWGFYQLWRWLECCNALDITLLIAGYDIIEQASQKLFEVMMERCLSDVETIFSVVLETCSRISVIVYYSLSSEDWHWCLVLVKRTIEFFVRWDRWVFSWCSHHIKRILYLWSESIPKLERTIGIDRS